MMRTLLVMTLVTLSFGCSGGPGYDGPERMALTGKVTFNGEPVEAGIISFVPQSSAGRTAGGTILAGEYSISEGQGVPEGTYKVEIRWSRPTGKKILDAEDTGEMVDETEQVIPAKFNTDTELIVNVDPENTEFNFELTSD